MMNRIGGVKSESGLVLFGVLAMERKPGTAGHIMSAMGKRDINIEFIAGVVGFAGKDNIVFGVKEDQADDVTAVLEAMKEELDIHTVSRRDGVGVVFTFGPDFRTIPGIAGQIFDIFGKAGINIIVISTSMAAVTTVIDHVNVAKAEAALKEVFETPLP